jgi:glucose-1-phosphate thymidylyltransferase
VAVGIAPVGAWLASLGSPQPRILRRVSVIALLTYTLGPAPFAYVGRGDRFVLPFFGLADVLGSAWVPQLVLPPAVWIAVHNPRDFPTVQRAGKRTQAVRLGDRTYHLALPEAAFHLQFVSGLRECTIAPSVGCGRLQQHGCTLCAAIVASMGARVWQPCCMRCLPQPHGPWQVECDQRTRCPSGPLHRLSRRHGGASVGKSHDAPHGAKMKGIILAGGSGTRLYPINLAVSKQLLPVYDKPMVYYPLSVLMLAGIREILLISTPDDLPRFRHLLGDGAHVGISITYAEQPRPEGLVQALIISKDFVGNGPCCLILGDNLFFGGGLTPLVRAATGIKRGGLVFAYAVKDPERYGVVEIGPDGRALSLEEKPQQPRSTYAVPGLYFYGPGVCDEAERLPRGVRGEFEITDLHRAMLARGELHVELMGRGIAWLDTGTHDSLLDAAQFVSVVQNRQGLMIACLEEIAWRQGWIGCEALDRAARTMGRSTYGDYIRRLIDEMPNS